MAFPGTNYAPPGVYTRTLFENPFNGSIDSLKIPVFIGEGNEFLVQRNLELVRGSSASIDQRRVNEDMTDRAVVSVSATGVVTLGAWNGLLTKLQVVNLPIVKGDGTGTVTTNRSDVSVTINGQPIVVLSVNGTTGIVELAQAPKAGDVVKITYFFKRTDTLITDDVSDQVSPEDAFVLATSGIADVNAPDNQGVTLDIHADILGPNGQVAVEANNVLNLIIDGVAKTITIPANPAYTMQQAANAIAGQAGGTSLVASTFVNNFGHSALRLTADQDITVLAGSANAVLGLLTNSASVRTKTFYTFQGPIVTGSNGGVTTTDPSHVTVKVNGVQVIPTAVNGAVRAVTLPTAPPVGATVTIRYYFNSWQDTFDYLQHDGVTSITAVGSVPDTADFTGEADYILKDDKILWGTAWLVEADETSAGAELFDESQVSGTLVDNRTYLSPCTAVVTTTGGVSKASQRDFLLPFAPTLGNGRDTPLGQSLFQTVSNGRIDLPVNRPDVVTAYWGYGVQDALDRGPISVLKVEGSVITLSEDVPPGAEVFASFYYNRLTDETYTLTNTLAGASGVGTYEVTKSDGSYVLSPTYSTASKGAGLAGVTLVFPSGSELTPDLRHESVSGVLFLGPVEETVTVQFATRMATPAKWAAPGAAPYWFVSGQSDRVRLQLDNNVSSVDPDGAGGETEAVGISLTNSTSFGGGFFASLLSEEIDYTGEPAGGAGTSVVGESYTLTTAEDLVLFIDGVQVDVTVPATAAAARSTIEDFANAINFAASGMTDLADGGGVDTITFTVAGAAIPNIGTAGFLEGWRITVGNHVIGGGIPTPGQTRTVIDHTVAGGIATLQVNAAWGGGAMVALVPVRIYNPATMAEMRSATRFNGATTISAGLLDTIRFEYRGSGSGTVASGSCVIAPGAYASAAALATAVQTAINGALGFDVAGNWAVPGVAFSGAQVEVTADGDGRLVVKLQAGGLDGSAAFRFLVPVTAAATHFHRLAGFDVGTLAGTDGAVLIQGEVAHFVVDPIPGPGTQHLHDRLILRNRLLPGGNATSSMTAHDIVGQTELRVGAGSGNTKAGLTNGDFGVAGFQATIQPASLAGRIGVAGGQSAVTGQPQVTFFDGTGATPANNVLRFTLDGVAVEVTFTASAAGTATDIGPASGTGNGSVCDQILAAIGTLPGTPFGNAATAFAAGVVLSEGAGFRITSQTSGPTSQVIIGTGSANAPLGLTAGTTATRSSVSAKLLASALNGNREDSFDNFLLDMSLSQGGGTPMFMSLGYAWVVEDSAGSEYLFLQSRSTGTGSVITVRDPVVGGVVTDSWLFSGTGINARNLDGAVGEAGLSGFFVTSNVANGSGSANDSLLNDGVGSDGVVGQTYRDPVTGLTFTILPQNFHDNPNGPWQAYPTGATATFRIQVSRTHTTDANLPRTSIPGFELKVSNTLDIGVGDTAKLQTFERGGEEPAIGDVYYATYVYTKESYNTAYFTKLSSIEAAYGSISSENPVTLAAFLASLNGAVLIGIKQVPKAVGSNYASVETYRDAIVSLEGVQPGQVNPDIIIPLRGDSTDLFTLLKKSNEIQSSIRYRAERTSIIGMSSGSDPVAAQNLAQTLNSDRMRMVYPDTAIISLTDAFNRTREELVDGPMLAAALAGSVVSPNLDVATPWTGRNLVGFVQLGRRLDAVEMNQTAQKGVTILEERPPFLRVRHGFTTDISNILRKTPTVRLIADEVQRQARAVLANFIGIKFLPGVLSQIEGRLAMMFKSLVAQQIITAYTGIKATVAPDDPTVAEVEAFYQPVFPLLYIVLTFHLRASL